MCSNINRTFGSAVYSPGTKGISEEFHVSNTVALLGVTVYVLGLAFGPVIAAPISETFGRLLVYRFSLPISLLFTLGVGFSNTFAGVIVCRFFAGLTGSPVLSVGAGTNADLFPPRTRASATSLFLLAPFLGTTIGPVVGGFAAQHKGWRWTQWSLLFIGLATYLVSLTTEETYKKTILEKRAKRLSIEPPKRTLPKGWPAIKFLLTVTLFRPIHMLLFEPIVMFLSLYSAFTFGVLFAFLPAFPFVFEGIYGFDNGHTGLTFLSIGVGIILAVPTALACDRWIYQKKHAEAIKQGKHTAAPEHRLYSAMMGGFGVSIGLFWFGEYLDASLSNVQRLMRNCRLDGKKRCPLDCSYYWRSTFWLG
jgi:MFS family permease